jgi:signal transduction histidine kinase
MKTMELTNNNSAKTVLQNAVDRLINSLAPVAIRNRSSFVNDIPAKLDIGNDENTVISVISGLLRSVINNSRESCIRISAKEMYGKMVTVSVKDSNSYNTYAVACSLQDVVPLAEKMGGRLDIISEKEKVTTFAFRFPIGQQQNQCPLS